MTTRRRFLTILASTSVLPLVGAKTASAVEMWQGVALGAKAQLVLDHQNAKTLIAEAVAEIQRMEDIFSLYKADSQLSQLNRHGVLDQPAFEFVELLSTCANLNAQTSGAFDPTIQPLWALYAKAFDAGNGPSARDIQNIKRLTGWQNLVFDTNKIQFLVPDMAMTLNGVAQGFIADKITAFFRRNGVTNVLVNTGEVSALGYAPDGAPWQAALAYDDSRKVPLTNATIATSSPHGTVFDIEGGVGHIIDPRTGYPGGKWANVSVVSHSAALADGLSTAFCLMSRDEIEIAAGPHEVILGEPIYAG